MSVILVPRLNFEITLIVHLGVIAPESHIAL